MINTVVDRTENKDMLLWIAQKMNNTVVDRAENEKYCCGSRRI